MSKWDEQGERDEQGEWDEQSEWDEQGEQVEQGERDEQSGNIVNFAQEWEKHRIPRIKIFNETYITGEHYWSGHNTW